MCTVQHPPSTDTAGVQIFLQPATTSSPFSKGEDSELPSAALVFKTPLQDLQEMYFASYLQAFEARVHTQLTCKVFKPLIRYSSFTDEQI
jgi:hypothetical protein